jgi:NAD(P)-dependent dehydrogenase (short-subunit alcohol dehydrogenase family)
MSVIGAHNVFINALPALRRAVKSRGHASVINVASMYGVVSPDLSVYKTPESSNPPFYGAAKAALIQWTRYAACEYGRENIRFNSVSPGPFPSAQVQADAPDFVRTLSQKVPLGRVGQPGELVGIMVFLASSASSFITGANIPVDGGWTSW